MADIENSRAACPATALQPCSKYRLVERLALLQFLFLFLGDSMTKENKVMDGRREIERAGIDRIPQQGLSIYFIISATFTL